MSSQIDQSPAELLSDESRVHAQKAMTRTAISWAVFHTTSITSVSALYLMSLGAEPFAVGMLATLFAIAPLGQLIGLKLLPRFGKTRLIMIGFRVAMIPLSGLVVLAITGWTGQAAICVALAGYAVTVFIRMIGSTGWWPLLQDVTAGEAIGSFFASLRMRLRMIEIFIPVVVGMYLGRNPAPARFALPIAMGVLATGVGSWLVRKVPERPVTLPSVGLLLRLRLAARGKSVRKYILFIMLCSLYLGLLMPFWVVILKQRGMSEQFVVGMFALRALGHIIGLRLWGKIVDIHNHRPALELSVTIMAMLGLSWLTLPPAVQAGGAEIHIFAGLAISEAELALIAWAAVFHLIWGFAEGGWMMGQTKAMLNNIPEVYQADGFTLSMLSGALSVAVGSFVGGLCFQALTDRPVTFAGFDLRVVFLAVGQLSIITILIAASRLTGHNKQISTGRLIATLWRRRMSR